MKEPQKILLYKHLGYIVWKNENKGYFAYYNEGEIAGRKYKKITLVEVFKVKKVTKKTGDIIKFQRHPFSEWDMKNKAYLVGMHFNLGDIEIVTQLLNHVYFKITGVSGVKEMPDKSIDTEEDQVGKLLGKFKL